MIAAKTFRGFPEIRRQFKSDHSLEDGGTEKYYFALVRGEVKVPTLKKEKSPDWCLEPCGPTKRRGRIQIAQYFDKARWKAFPCDDGSSDKGKGKETNWNRTVYGKSGEEREGREKGGRQDAITFYEPIAWFTDRLKSDDQYTLLYLQIITGRTHQIRFHCSQIGHPLVGDCQYGAPQSDRNWARRMCLHSYKTKFMEPFSEKWYEAVSPLPQDFGEILSKLRLRRVQEGCPLFLSRRQHAPLQKMFRPYDATSKLLQPHDAPRNAPSILGAKAQAKEDQSRSSSGAQEKWSDWDSWKDEKDERKDERKERNSTSKDTSGSWNSWAHNAMDDDETWGTWKPLPDPVQTLPVPEPEPPCKRPRTDAESSQPLPRTPPELELEQAVPPSSAWRRQESTRQAGVFYYYNIYTMETQVEPPAPWERLQSRRDPTIFYYWNPITNVASLMKPEIS
eukprot:Skav203217  [mRNA]  locus=scaffold2292:53102:54451:+ [translate_table: standard]